MLSKTLLVAGACLRSTKCFKQGARKDGRGNEQGGRKDGRGNEPVVMRGVLGRERSRGRTVKKWRVKIKFCSIYKAHCYG